MQKGLNSRTALLCNMKATVVLDEKSVRELEELSSLGKASKSSLIRKAVEDLYLKEKRARNNLLFFVDQYNKGIVDKGLLFLLLSRKDAEAIIIGSVTGKEAAGLAKSFGD